VLDEVELLPAEILHPLTSEWLANVYGREGGYVKLVA
jgi:hypothetical protein